MARGLFAGVVIRASRATVMRSARPELIDIVRQTRTAVAWALACSGIAAVLALALPVLILHVVAAIERKTSFDALALTAVATLTALVIRSVLLGVRQRLLTSAALWSAHGIGRCVLSRGLECAQTPSGMDHDQRIIEHVQKVLAGPALAALLDLPFLIFPLALLLWLQPALAVVTLGLVGVLLCACVRLTRSVPKLQAKANTARAAAQDAWRTAAASSVVIEARGMTAGIVHDWQTLSSRAVASTYAVDQRMAASAATLRLCLAVGPVLLLILSAWSAVGDSLTVDVTITALLLNAMVVQTLGAALTAIGPISDAYAGLKQVLADAPRARAETSPLPVAQQQQHARAQPQPAFEHASQTARGAS